MIATGAPLAIDETVPGAAVITDHAELGRRLAGIGEQLLAIGYLRSKPGTSVVAGLRLGSGPAFAYAVGSDARAKLAKTIARAPGGSVLLAEPESGLLVARPPADRDLPALADLEAVLATVTADGPCRPPGPLRSAATLAYKPQRRWVGRLDRGDAPSLVARVYRPADLPAALAGWDLAARLDGPVRTPVVRATSTRSGLVLTDWVPGTPLDWLLAAGDVAAQVLHELGVGLARLHAADRRPVGSATGAARADGFISAAGSISAVAEQVATLAPELAARVHGLADRLLSTAAPPEQLHPVHGDFSADQVIVDRADQVTVTDWDRARWDDPAVDLGSLRAAGVPPAAYERLLAGYATVRPVPPTVDWHLARARLLRLPEPYRRARLDWRVLVAARVAEIEQRLDPGTREAPNRREVRSR
jgi:Ser/Thr protein kinase RdoA (MazF antagonist)